MKTSLNGARLGAESLTLLEFVELAARQGFDGVDFGIGAAMRTGLEFGGADLLSEYFHERNIAPAAFGLEVDWRRDEVTYQQGMGALEDQARFAQAMGATRCVTWMPPSVHNAEEWDRIVVRRFGEIAAVLERFDIRLGLEWVGPHHLRAGEVNAMGPEPWIYTMPDTLDLIDRIGVRQLAYWSIPTIATRPSYRGADRSARRQPDRSRSHQRCPGRCWPCRCA